MTARPWWGMRAAIVLASVLLGQQDARAQQDNADNVKRLKTWRLADMVSQNTIGHALGADKDVLVRLRKDAEELARELDVRLADLPRWKGAPSDDVPLAVTYLLEEVSGKISAQLAARDGHEYRATFDLAVMINLTVLLYSPDAGAQTQRLGDFLERAGRDARLPEGLWKDSVAKIRKREAAADVNKELKASRQAIGRYLEQKAGLDSPMKEGPAGPDEPRPRLTRAQRTGRSQVWQLSRVLSAAAIGHMKGNKEAVEVLMKEGSRLAKDLDVELPELPARQNDQARDGLAALTYLIKTVGDPLRKEVTRKFGADSAKLYDLGVHSSLLTLLYGPEIPARELRFLRQMIEEAAQGAGVPERFWKPLLKKIDDKADGAEVRQAVVDMQTAIADWLENEAKRE
jgi:hypothetical protein